MGTRSTTKVYLDSERKKFLCCLYGQYDGYLSGHGRQLKEFIAGKKIINGIRNDTTIDNSFNGMGCLAAAVVAHFKCDIGYFYLFPEYNMEEYNYILFPGEDEAIMIEITNADDKVMYSGHITEMPIIDE